MALVFNKAGSESGIALSQTYEIIFELKTLLKAQGWTVPQTGTGTAGAFAASDQFATAASLNATRAWFEIRDPANARSFVFQRVSFEYQWRIKYTLGTFGAGAPNENTVPSSATEVVVWGSGSDASPTGLSLGGTSALSRVIQIAVDSASPYGFWLASYRQGTPATDDLSLFMDPLKAGSYDPSDADPVVVGVANATTATTFTTVFSAWGRISASTVQVALGQLYGWGTSSTVIAPRGAGTDPLSGDDIAFPAIWGRYAGASAPTGYKGVSSLFELTGSARTNGDTNTRSTTRDKIILFGNALICDWNGEVPLV